MRDPFSCSSFKGKTSGYDMLPPQHAAYTIRSIGAVASRRRDIGNYIGIKKRNKGFSTYSRLSACYVRPSFQP
jgi:hypothetical protein